MSEIKRGDLVVAVRGCPKCGYRSGFVFTVFSIVKAKSHCSAGCGWQSTAQSTAATYSSGRHGIPVSWLRKIDPPATGEYGGVSVRKTLKHKEPA